MAYLVAMHAMKYYRTCTAVIPVHDIIFSTAAPPRGAPIGLHPDSAL